jgi:hypothetical protein
MANYAQKKLPFKKKKRSKKRKTHQDVDNAPRSQHPDTASKSQQGFP